jgi:transglutaminase-like putative cysteine protease
MRFHINHTTRYTYSRPVFLEPHVVRLRPRCDASQCLSQYRVEVKPGPTGFSEGLDAENNAFRLLWFDGLCEHLEITVTAEVETLRTNPYEGLLVAGAAHLPLGAGLRGEAPLRVYLEPNVERKQVERGLLEALVDELLGETEGRTLDFLGGLAARLHRTVEKIERVQPGIQSVDETLSTKRGACRDLAVVFMAACRGMGVPARFVSGYQEGDPEESYGDLHAWAEVFLPGFGWRGYDPTHGLAVADRHVVVAAAALPDNAAPVAGTFRGTSAQANLEHSITIHGD